MALCVAHNILMKLAKSGFYIECLQAYLLAQWCPDRDVPVSVIKIPFYIDESTQLKIERCFKTFQWLFLAYNSQSIN